MKISTLQKALKRERLARKEAEKILEEKSLELYQTNQNLIKVLDEKEIHLESLFKTIVDPYILMDLYGNVLKMNDSAVDFFGYNVENESFNVTTTLHEEDVEYAMNCYAELLEKGIFRNFRARVYNRNREIRWIEINSSIVYDHDNQSTFAQGIIRDITEDLQAQKERDQLLENLTRSNKELKDFAHVVSHDLKAPLRSMNALVTWLKEDVKALGEDENIDYNFNLLINKIDKMDHFINGILKYSSIDKVEKKNHNVDINEIVNDIVNAIHIPEKKQVIIPKELPTIQGQKFRFQQLFQNLMSNAVKYADENNGIIEITCREADEHTWEFQIKDNGSGIEEKYHEKIFEIFQTLDADQKSTGIGLSIVKKIVDLYKGKIWVNSALGEGTTFHFTLPK